MIWTNNTYGILVLNIWPPWAYFSLSHHYVHARMLLADKSYLLKSFQLHGSVFEQLSKLKDSFWVFSVSLIGKDLYRISYPTYVASQILWLYVVCQVSFVIEFAHIDVCVAQNILTLFTICILFIVLLYALCTFDFFIKATEAIFLESFIFLP